MAVIPKSRKKAPPGSLLEQIVEAIETVRPQRIYMNEHTFEQVVRDDGRTDNYWRPGAKASRPRSFIAMVQVEIIEEMADGEWVFG